MQLESVSVLIGAVTESNVLEKTVAEILALPERILIKEILIAYPAERVTPACKSVLESIQNDCSHPDITIKVVAQKTPKMGFFSDLFKIASGTHCVLFSSDGAMPVSLIEELVKKEKEYPEAIVSSSRWLEGGSFGDYNRGKLLLNRLSQIYLRVLYHTNLTDMTNAVQIAPTQLMRCIQWEQTGFSRGMEMVIKPLRLGVEIIEIPTQYTERTEGKSNNSIFELFDYLKVSIKVRLMTKERIIESPVA